MAIDTSSELMENGRPNASAAPDQVSITAATANPSLRQATVPSMLAAVKLLLVAQTG